MKIECKNPEAVVKRAFYLAYLACGGPTGMGVFQARSDATEEDVWKNVSTAGDYQRQFEAKSGYAYGDYVFGRMMKLGLHWDDAGVKFQDGKTREDYQAWSRVYPSYETLVRIAIESVEKEAQ